MIIKKRHSRQIPGIISYLDFFSSKKLAYLMLTGTPIILGFLSLVLNYLWIEKVDLFHFFRFTFLFIFTATVGSVFSLVFYSKKSPILKAPPSGWSVQMNAFFSFIMEVTFIFGQIITVLLHDIVYQEVFLILGSILAYIIAFVIYFSFTTVGRIGNVILSLIQPISVILLYSLYTGQFRIEFFIRAMIFFIACALIFIIPYRRGLFRVSNIYQEATGAGGYAFIRAFILSMMTNGNDEIIESYFDRVGVKSDVKIQYLFIRSIKQKKIKGFFVIPNVHFGPFKTCGSADLPEHIYKEFSDIPGTTVLHSTNDHTQNLTTQGYIDEIIKNIKKDIHQISSDKGVEWIREIRDFTRKISNSAKLIGTEVANVPLIFITRHPLPSDDIEIGVGENIRKVAMLNGYKDIIIIDSHNAIIGDEILIKEDSIESKDLIDVSKKFMESESVKKIKEIPMLYGVANDHLDEYNENDGIGSGGVVVHLFKNMESGHKTALVHFDGNNAYVEIRSNILNFLQNQGIEKGEITTSDSHTVARQFSNRGYSPIGDKIKIDYILNKLEILLKEAESNMEPVEFLYKDSILNLKIWGNPQYFNTIIDTLKECIRVSQNLLTISLILPTFLSLILLVFLYRI